MYYQSMQSVPVNSSCGPICSIPISGNFFQNYYNFFENKISHLSFSIDNRINGIINKNSKSFSKINSSVNAQKNISNLERRNRKFKDRVSNLELLIFANKINDLENAKNAFNTYVIRQSQTIKKIKLDLSKLESNFRLKSDEEEIKNQVKNNYEHFTKAYESVLRLIKKSESDINEQLESIRLKNKEYKELKQLKFELVQKRGEFNQFKKYISNFENKIKYFTLIIIINVIIIFCLLLFIYLKIN